MSEQDCGAAGVPRAVGRHELGSTPRGAIAGQAGLLELVFRHSDGATVEDVVRMVYRTPTYSYGYELAGIDALRQLDPAVLRAVQLPSTAGRA
jgi:hypothetical protein